MVIGYVNSQNTSSTKAAYGHPFHLTALPFIQEGSSTNALTATTSNVLPVRTVGTLALPSYNIPGTSTPVNVYGLMACQANNFFPIDSYWRSVQQGVVPAITLPSPSPCNSSSAANAYVFLQNLLAYPTSPLAQQFTAVLNAASSPTSSGNGSTTIDAFFTSSADYQNVNYEIFSAVMNYVQAFPYAWANFASSFTYNVYAEQLTCLGTVVLTLQNTAPTTVAEALAAYTITWFPSGQTPVTLSFSGGQFVAPESAGFSGICLQTVFMDMAALSGDPSDSGTPTQALIGLINGINVFAIPISLAAKMASLVAKATSLDASTADSSSDGSSSDGSSSGDSTRASQIFMLIVIILGGLVIFSLLTWVTVFLVKAYFFPTNKITFVPGRDAVKEELESDGLSDINENLDEEGPGSENEDLAEEGLGGNNLFDFQAVEDFSLSYVNQRLKNAGIDQQIKPGQDLNDFQAEAETSLLNALEQTAEFGQIRLQSQLEDEQLVTGNNATIQDEISNTQSAMSQLEKINPETQNASAELATVQTNLTANQAAIVSENQKLNPSDQGAVQKQQAADENLEEVEASDQQKEQEIEDDDPANDEADL